MSSNDETLFGTMASNSKQKEALAAKEAGNESFKKGDWVTAVGFYSQAFILDPKNPTYTLNRAQAYLKLEKFTDAERDCTTCIALDPTNPKSWFRRGVARRGLGDWAGSRADLKKTQTIDPKNPSVAAELAKTDQEEKLEKEKKEKKRVMFDRKITEPTTGKSTPAPKTALKSASSTSIIPPRTRRDIPIQVLYPLAPSTPVSSAQPTTAPLPEQLIYTPAQPLPASNASSAPISSQQEKPDITASIFPTVPSKPNAFSALKTSRTARLSSPLSSTSSSLIQEVSSTQVAEEKSAKILKRPIPKTSVELERDLELLAGDETGLWDYISSIPPDSLPSLIQHSLEPHILSPFVKTLSSQPLVSSRDKQSVKDLVEGMEKVSRFKTVLWLSDDNEAVWEGLKAKLSS